MTISLISGLRMWRIVAPASVGLNGAKPPYGFGMPSDSGMYALGRGSAVVCTSETLESSSARSSARSDSASDSCMRDRSIRYHSRSASSVGGRPASTRACAFSTSASRSAFSAPSLRLLAWYIDSSDTVAMTRRVTARSRPWYSLTRCASSSVSPRPSDACARSLSLRLVISSRMSCFSSSASFLSFSRSSSCWTLASSSSLSGIFPSSMRQRLWLLGFSSAALSASASLRVTSSAFCSLATSSSRSGTWGTSFIVALHERSSSIVSSRSTRASSSRIDSSSMPALMTWSCTLVFSYIMHSSSLRSISMRPV
mmetsp:Transcript_31125/g.92770  ORF Transcript_31125/g.92770 Transcript_31125/m.92770 type:complete len:312 (-) Transcript_31125:1943-2878(-)